MRGVAVLLVAGLVSAVAGVAGPVPGPAVASAARGSGRASAAARPDFDHDGFGDLAMAAPGAVVNGHESAGAVVVLFGSSAGLRGAGAQMWTQDSPGVKEAAESFDHFGTALAWGDFNGDSFDDLAVGTPSESLGSTRGAGAVNVLYGSSSGLTSTGNQLWSQNSPKVKDQAEGGDSFGFALSMGDFDADGFADLGIGVVDETVIDIPQAGAVNVLYGSSGGLAAARNQFWTQSTKDVEDFSEPGDFFGEATAAGDFNGDGADDLAVGASDEDVGLYGGIRNAGAVNVLYGKGGTGLSAAGDQLWTQDTLTVQEQAEQDDFFGGRLVAGNFGKGAQDDLAVSAIFEDLPDGSNTTRDAGSVNIVYGSPTGLTDAGNQLLSQNGSDLEQGDQFGWSLAAGNFGRGPLQDLAVGVPFEDFGGVSDAGAVDVFSGSTTGLDQAGQQNFVQDIFSPESLDGYGWALAAADLGRTAQADLSIGVPFEDFGGLFDAGEVDVIYGTTDGLAGSGSQAWTQDTTGVPGSAADDANLGSALSR